ncbi:MAG: type II secretion system major pseudopilin GspG [Myxococcota bacterium]
MRATHAEVGMTLVELMVVIAIMALVASLVGVSVVGVYDRARVHAAQIQVSSLGESLEHFSLLTGEYPEESEGLGALAVSRNGAAAILEEIPKDPWKLDYNYTNPGKVRSHVFDVSSFGPDKLEDTADDIGTWSKQ